MQTTRFIRLGELWASLVAATDSALDTPQAQPLLKALRREYDAIEDEARQAGFGAGYERGRLDGDAAGYTRGVEDADLRSRCSTAQPEPRNDGSTPLLEALETRLTAGVERPH